MDQIKITLETGGTKFGVVLPASAFTPEAIGQMVTDTLKNQLGLNFAVPPMKVVDNDWS